MLLKEGECTSLGTLKGEKERSLYSAVDFADGYLLFLGFIIYEFEISITNNFRINYPRSSCLISFRDQPDVSKLIKRYVISNRSFRLLFGKCVG